MGRDEFVAQVFQIGRWTVEPRRLRVTDGECEVRLQRRVMALLVALASRPGSVLTRDELVAAAWDGRVVGDDAIQRAVAELRRALSADTGEEIVETIPRVGYRLVPQVLPVVGRLSLDEAPADPAGSTNEVFPPHRRLWPWLAALAGVAVLALALKLTPPPPADVAVPYRLAVLPLAVEGMDAATSGGFHASFVAQLARIPGMQVLSANAGMPYGHDPQDFTLIARELGVAGVLGTRVRQTPDRQRMEIRLIEVPSGRILWTDEIERGPGPLSELQTDAALRVARRMERDGGGLALAGTRATGPDASVAFQHYLSGRGHLRSQRFEDAIRDMTLATTADPSFTAAYAHLALAHVWASRRAANAAASERHLLLSQAAIDRALTLDPHSEDAQFAQGIHLYSGLQRATEAEPWLERAVRALPNEESAHAMLAYLHRRQGRIQEAIDGFRHAVAIDPRSSAVYALPNTLVQLGRYDEALSAAKAGLVANPAHDGLWLIPAMANLVARCEPEAAAAQLALVPAAVKDGPFGQRLTWELAMTRGDARMARETLEREPGGVGRDDDLRWPLTLAALGETEAAKSAFARVRAAVELKLAQPRLPAADVARGIGLQAIAAAGEGDAAAARRYAVHLAGLASQMDDDLMAVRDAHLQIVEAYGLLGDAQSAMPSVEAILGSAYPLVAADIWCRHGSANLRQDPAFRDLMARHGVDVTRDPREGHH